MFEFLSFRHLIFGLLAFILLGTAGDMLGEYNYKYKELLGMKMIYGPLFLALIALFDLFYHYIKKL